METLQNMRPRGRTEQEMAARALGLGLGVGDSELGCAKHRPKDESSDSEAGETVNGSPTPEPGVYSD